jgi:putative peptidoglycan lipid II flippase
MPYSPMISRSVAKMRENALVRGGLVVGGGILAGNVVGFVRVGVTAWFLGTHANADALAVATGPVDTVATAVINTLLVSFVPMLMLRSGDERSAMFAKAGKAFATIFAALSGAIFVFASHLISVLGPGLHQAEHDQATLLLRILAPAIFFAGSSSIFAALLYSERRFVIPALYQACVNGSMVLAAIVLWKAVGVYAFAVGYTAGTAIQLGLTWHASRHLIAPLRRRQMMSPGFREILYKPGMFLLYAGLISANVLVTRAVATHAGPGMAAAFDYCLRCISVVVAYLVYPVANSLVPELAQLQMSNQTARAYSLIGRSVRLAAGFALAAVAIGLLVRTEAIAILFQRGSFTPESTALVAAVFLGFAPGILGWTLMDLGSRCLFALNRAKLPVIAGLVPVSVNLAVMLALGWPHRTVHPNLLAVGASVGLLCGFGALFVGIRLSRLLALVPEPQPEPAQLTVR